MQKYRGFTRIAADAVAATSLACAIMSSAAHGQWEQAAKLIPHGYATSDYFGGSTAISGNTIVIGAYGDDDWGFGSGSAYVYNATTGEPLHTLTAGDAAAGDGFGVSVSISGGRIVVGAFCDDDAGDGSGSAYLFDAYSGQQIYKLTADDAAESDLFGDSVSISGSMTVIGARRSKNDEGVKTGAAYIFDALTGEQLHKLTADDGEEGDWFGWATSISGNTVVVGAWLADHAGEHSGAAYVFDAITGEQLHKLIPTDAAAYRIFGYSVAVSGDTIVIGANGDDDGAENSGAAYVFDASNGQQLHKLKATEPLIQDLFGRSVGISADTIVVGAYSGEAPDGSGSAYVFDAASGEQLQKLTADDAAEDDAFGSDVSIFGKTINNWRAPR